MNSIITGNEKGKCFICGRHMPRNRTTYFSERQIESYPKNSV
nr:MAG TPA: hypothetical protein [Caudoviricetes sp.]